MSLEYVTGRRRAPMRLMVYGPPKVGKTTLASEAEDPIFLSGEDGDSELDVKRYCFDSKTKRTQPKAWPEVPEALKKIAADGGGKTLVIDGMSALELLCASYICEKNKWASLASPGFSKGEGALLNEMRVFLKLAEDIWMKGLNIIIVAHVKITKVKNPEGEEYHTYSPALCTVNNADVAGLFVGWADAVLFARPEIETAKVAERVLGVSTGRHLLYTQGTAAFVAGCRYDNVDPVLDLSFAEFRRQVEEGQSVEKMRAKVTKLATGIGGDTAKRVGEWLTKPGSNDVKALNRSALALKRESGTTNSNSEQAVA